MPSFQVPVLGFADGFLSPFPDSLPQLFLRCLPCAFAFGLSPSDPLSFVRFSSGSDYSASVSSFPLLPRFASQWLLSGAASLPFGFLAFPLPFRSIALASLPFQVLSSLQFLSPFAVSPHSGYLSASAFFLSVSGFFPLAFALGSGYLA